MKCTKKANLLQLLRCQYVTPLIALQHVGILSLAQRISEWRASGYEFHQRWVRSDGSRVAAYRLHKAPKKRTTPDGIRIINEFE